MIPLAEPNLTGKEKEYVSQAIASGWVSGGGPFVERFEEMVAKACGQNWCVATTTGSAAIHLALTACGMRRGMAVDIPSMAYIASANAVNLKGGAIRLTDLPPDWTYDRTLLGGVIDAAPAVGVPQEGLALCLSFNGNKTITTGQGGAVVGKIGALGELVRHLANQAKVNAYEHDAVGYNYRMANINAALGCAQMERLDEFLATKRRIWQRYADAGYARGRLGCKARGSCWMPLATSSKRDSLIAHLRLNRVDARRFWKPLHLQPPYEACARMLLPDTTAIWDKLICLPCSTNLTPDDQDKVIEACAAFSQ